MFEWLKSLWIPNSQEEAFLSQEELQSLADLLGEHEEEIYEYHSKAIASIKEQRETVTTLVERLDEIKARADLIAGDDDG